MTKKNRNSRNNVSHLNNSASIYIFPFFHIQNPPIRIPPRYAAVRNGTKGNADFLVNPLDAIITAEKTAARRNAAGQHWEDIPESEKASHDQDQDAVSVSERFSRRSADNQKQNSHCPAGGQEDCGNIRRKDPTYDRHRNPCQQKPETEFPASDVHPAEYEQIQKKQELKYDPSVFTYKIPCLF